MNPIRITPSASRPSTLPHSRIGLRPRSAALLLPLVIGLQGCAALTHYNAVRDLDGAPGTRSEAILMDAKQRGVYTIARTETEKEGDRIVQKAFQSFCAEPSPDALSNLAAQFGATVNVDTRGGGSINGGFSEGAASIGLRTTSIQILRDITYRQCEAYANGGISKLGLETLQRRFQSTMVALLSIEQLTGAVRAPAVVLSGNAAANNAELVANLTQKTEAARAAVAEGEADLKKKESEAAAAAAVVDTAKKQSTANTADKAEIQRLEGKSPKTDDDTKKVNDLKTAVDKREKDVADAEKAAKLADAAVADAKKTLAERKQSLAAIDAARIASLTTGGTTGTAGDIRPFVIPSSLDSNAAAAVAGAVTNIVRDTLSLGYGQEVCTSIIGDQTDPARAVALARMEPAPASDNASGSDKAAAVKSALEKTAVASVTVLGKCLDLISAEAGYYTKLEGHLDAKTRLISSVADAINKCATTDACASNTNTVKELVNALRIASEAQVGASPVLLTNPVR